VIQEAERAPTKAIGWERAGCILRPPEQKKQNILVKESREQLREKVRQGRQGRQGRQERSCELDHVGLSMLP
jgi:hypothetical protein